MEFNFTKDLLYKNCASRIAIRQKEKKISNRKLYPQNPKIIGQILKCQTDQRRNRYLLQNAVLHAINKELNFDGYENILWGNAEERTYYIPVIFQHIIYDLLSPSSKYKNSVDTILCRYVPYARYSAYYHLLYTPRPALTDYDLSIIYEVDKFDIQNDIDQMIDEAIADLYINCSNGFQSLFFAFIEENKDSFKCIDRKLETWVNDKLLVFLQKYIPSENSLGIRIRNIINSDYLYIPQLMSFAECNNPDTESLKQLVIATDKYIQELEQIQNNCINRNLFY